jgi:hypothetical protein
MDAVGVDQALPVPVGSAFARDRTRLVFPLWNAVVETCKMRMNMKTTIHIKHNEQSKNMLVVTALLVHQFS